MHRLIARRLRNDPALIDDGRAWIARQRAEGFVNDYLDAWEGILALPVSEMGRLITQRTEKMERLRNSSPLVLAERLGLRDVEFRRRIWRKAKLGLILRAALVDNLV